MTATPTVSPYLTEMLEACRALCRDDPRTYPTLKAAWLELTEEDRILGPEDYQWHADVALRTAQARKHAGRVAHARPSTRGLDPREPVPKRVARRIRALHPLCHYCGGMGGQIDHIWPLARGGANHWTNYANACKRCNLEKRDKTVAEWRAQRERNDEAWPPRPYWTTDTLERLRKHSAQGAAAAAAIVAELGQAIE